MAAGAATKKGVIGYIVPFGIPEVVRHINAFTLGAQATHPGAKVKIIWTNAWYSPPKETAAAKALVAAGADVLGQNVDSPAAGVYAEKAGIPWVGYDSDAKKFAPKQWLTASVYNWGPYYVKRIKAAMDGTWKPGFYYGSIKDGFTKLAPYGPSVTAKTKAAIAAKLAAIVSGKFDEFSGPLYDQSGKLKVPKGKYADKVRPDLYSMQWLVKGVVGLRLPRPAAGLAAWGSRPHPSDRQREAPAIPAPLPPSRCAGSRSASRACSRTTASTSRRRAARCTRCSARTAPARARSRTS